MADSEGEIELLNEPEVEDIVQEPTENEHQLQSSMEGHFEALSVNIKAGFDSLGELLSGLMRDRKRSRQKSRSYSSSSSDDEPENNNKRKRVADDENNDVDLLLGKPENAEPEQDKAFGEILDSVAQELDQEQLGPNVSDQLAQVINKTLRTKLSEEKLKEKQNAYPRPQNCATLEATRVNPEIWAQLQPSTRSRDIRLQKVQSLLLKGLMPLIQLLEICRQSQDAAMSNDKGKIIRLILDAVTLFAQANAELNSRRRAMIKPDLNEKFQQICGDHVPITTFLFGDDVAKTLQDIASTNRVSQKIAGPSRSNSYSNHKHNVRPYSKNGRGRFRPHNNLPKRKGGNYKSQSQ